jgi:2-keto-3-deoxygluconate permease
VPILTALWVRRYRARHGVEEMQAEEAVRPIGERDVHA